MSRRILLLAGTAEAAELARALAADGHRVLASLAGTTARPRGLDVPLRIGGFGGEAGFLRVLAEAGITEVIDATHPFAARIPSRSARLCAGAGIGYLRLLRPGWQAVAGDDWRRIAQPEAAVALVPEGARVLLAVGPRSLSGFAGLAGRRLFCRRIDAVESPPPIAGASWLVGRPGDVAAERALLQRHRIGWIVTKDSGGAGARAKLDAARALGLPVIIQRRPDPPDGAERVADVPAALDWIARR